MKFDVVLSNPPYQDDTKGDAKRWPLWHKFLVKSFELLKLNGYLGFVTPNSWMSPGASYDLIASKNVLFVSLDVEKYFSVGSTFSYYVIQNFTKQKNTVIWNGQEEKSVDLSDQIFLPTKVSSPSLSINQKAFGKSNPKMKFQRTTEYHTSNKALFSDDGLVEIFHTNAQTLHSNAKHSNNEKHRVMISLSGYPIPKYVHGVGASQAVAWVETENEEQGLILEAVLKSKLYQYLIVANKWSGWNSLITLKNLPMIDFSRPWTDEELYDHFNLTQEEIDLIESTVND